MARRPRPVNPDEGPVQAFAFDLRALRDEAGNPTYRALSRTAGYSATTLGDAAGGVHLPTLEVTAAYVGACGGDVEAWRARWQEVSREVGRKQCPAEETVEETAEKPAPEALPADQPRQRPRRRGRRTYVVWIGAAAVVAGVLVAAATTMGNPAPKTKTTPSAAAQSSTSAAAGCPAIPASTADVAFTGKTYGIGANVRTGASLQSPMRQRIPAGCTVAFSGYCLGDVVTDETAGTPDMRWFILSGGGEVSSAIVHGDPPASLAPRPCPDDVPSPASISVTVSRNGTGGGVAELLATGSRLWIVGFAAYYPNQGSGTGSSWHQLGFGDTQSGGAFASSPLRLDGATSPVPVVAVACLGGDGPTAIVATGAVRPSAPQQLQPMPSQYAATLPNAEGAACAYPGSGT